MQMVNVRFIVHFIDYTNNTNAAKIKIYILIIEFFRGVMYHLSGLLSKRKKQWGEEVTFEANGMLPAGFHDCSVQEFIATFVDNFPTSQRRRIIMEALWDFSREVYNVGIPGEFWVDGSFVTAKVNPNDANLVLFLQIPNMNVLGPQLMAFRQKYKDTLDIYFAYAASPENQQYANPKDYQQFVNQRNYWRGQFGFDRADSPKGIVRISSDSIAEYLKGR